MILRYDVYVGGSHSREYEVTPLTHESQKVPVRSGYLCIRHVTIHRFQTVVIIWGHFDLVPAIWRATSEEAIVLAETIISAGDFMVGFTKWCDSLRSWKVDPTVSEACENELMAAISRFPNRWLQRYLDKYSPVGTHVPGKK